MNITHRFHFSSHALYWVFVAFIVLISLSLLLGFLTLVGAVIACVTALANVFLIDQPEGIYILGALTSAALCFLGPGAYSIDARLWGLRVTVVHPRKDHSIG